MSPVCVDDQTTAHDFYTKKLGFVVKNDIPMGEHRWLTVISAEQPMDAGPVRMAVLDDTCGNLIQLIEMKEGS